MAFKTRLERISRVFVLAVFGLLLIAFCFVQVQEHLLRNRAERLRRSSSKWWKMPKTV